MEKNDLIDDVKKIYWHHIKEKFKSYNENLANIIDTLDPNNQLPLIQVRYKLGTKIIENGEHSAEVYYNLGICYGRENLICI